MYESKLVPIIESYNTEEEFLYDRPYLFIKGYATARNMKHTLKALPLARKFHNGQYRNGTIKIDDKDYQLPYVLHVLKVCSTLISLNLPLTNEELDILASIAILHDSLEDAEDYFPKGGKELISEYGFPEEVYTGVKLLSKHSGSDELEINRYFNKIKKNKLALLVKLADRSHNVEDLHVMKLGRLQRYVKETREYIYPLCTYGKANYPELSNGFTILKAKIVSLTEATETIVEHYETKLKEKDNEINALKEEIEKLKNK